MILVLNIYFMWYAMYVRADFTEFTFSFAYSLDGDDNKYRMLLRRIL